MDGRDEPLDPSEIRDDIVDGVTIYDREDNAISTVEHLVGEGEKARVVFDVGGFLGIGSRRVGLFASQLDFMRDQEGKVYAVTQMTLDQLEALPEHTG